MSNSDDEAQIARDDAFQKAFEERFGRPEGSGSNGEMTEEEFAQYDYDLRQYRKSLYPHEGLEW